jgi:hypothetical protein
VQAQFRPGHPTSQFLANSAAGQWADAVDLLRAGTLAATATSGAGGGDRAATDAAAFVAAMTELPAGVGISLRWAVAAAVGGRLELQLQALPCNAATTRVHPRLRQDNTEVIVLCRIGLTYSSDNEHNSDRSLLLLPPYEPKEAAALLNANWPPPPSLTSRLPAPVSLTAAQAAEFVQSVREGRTTAAVRPLRRSWERMTAATATTETPTKDEEAASSEPKRARTRAPTGDSTGRVNASIVTMWHIGNVL